MVRINTFLALFCALFLFVNNSHAQMEEAKLIITDGLDIKELKTKIETNTSLLLTAMGKAVMDGTLPDTSGIEITPEASKILFSMWETSAMSCPVTIVERKCLYRPQGGYQVRDIPVTMMEAVAEEDEKQNIVINYTDKGVIDDIFIAVNSASDILIQNISVQDFTRRQLVLDLIERFRTAYNLKDLKYLQKVYSNNALIITGRVIKETPNSDQVLKGNLNRERIVYVTQTKERYLAKLKVVFAVNKYISVKFDDIEILQHPRYPEIYGVTLKQDWHTSGYSDKGYVFLMIDFKDEKEPVIHVRTWQPDKYNGKALSRDEVFTLDSFTRVVR